LHAVQLREDATQLRRRVLVEGRRTETLVGWPTDTGPADPPYSNPAEFLGLPLADATLFDNTGGLDDLRLVRTGTQWLYLYRPINTRPAGVNPPQTKVQTAFTPGDATLTLEALPMVPDQNGWIRVGNQYARYMNYVGDPLIGPWSVALTPDVNLPAVLWPYGRFTVPIAVGETVEWVDGVGAMHAHGLNWDGVETLGDRIVRGQPPQTPTVLMGVATVPPDRGPPLEGFVQDGRYSYPGAHARAAADLAAFQDPLVSLEWQTDDLNALPGRSQVIALSSAAVNPAVNTTVTILVEITFPFAPTAAPCVAVAC
jgi:hypothetical protein